MPDVVGYRQKIAVIIPSTNTVVEADYSKMAPPGVTFHAGRMYIANPVLDSDEGFKSLISQIDQSIMTAIRDVMTCQPDFMIMGMSAAAFWGGLEGATSFTERIKAASGLGVVTGPLACRQALDLLRIKRIAILTPYQPIADAEVEKFFVDAGFEVVALRGLRCPSATSIAQVTEQQLIRVLRDLDDPKAEAIVQVGTDLSMVRLADEAERWMGKPVIAINAASVWSALRASNVPDRFPGFGSLLRDY